jgi:hypothetical protein
MHVAKSILLMLSGATAGIAFVISCGDNWHLGADAAVDAPKTSDAAPVCDCPAAEPPLDDRLVVTDVLDVLGGNGQRSIQILCPAGARPISGSCTVDGPFADKDVILRQSGFVDDPPSWRCSYRNNEPTTITFRVAVLCLKPAP